MRPDVCNVISRCIVKHTEAACFLPWEVETVEQEGEEEGDEGKKSKAGTNETRGASVEEGDKG